MPIRMLRDWTDSYRFDQLTPNAEVLFTRLIMKADDFGNYHGDSRIVESMCFPLGCQFAVDAALDELAIRGLIMIYEVDARKYLNIPNFGQRMRTHVRKFPPHGGELPQADDNARPERKKNRIETEENKKQFDTFWSAYPKKVGRGTAEAAWANAEIPELEVILKALHKAKQSPDWIKEKGAFIPHPSTWLNQRRWEDSGMDFAALSSKRLAGAFTAQESAIQIDEQDAKSWITENYDNVQLAGSFNQWPPHIQREYQQYLKSK